MRKAIVPTVLLCAKSASALGNYLDRQVKEGVITPAERRAIGH